MLLVEIMLKNNVRMVGSYVYTSGGENSGTFLSFVEGGAVI